MAKRSKLAQEAEGIVNGDRQEAYGDALEMLQGLATIWSVILGGRSDAEASRVLHHADEDPARE